MVADCQDSSPVITTSADSVFINGKKYPLSEQVLKNIESVIGFQAKQVKDIPIHERVLTRVAAFFGKPEFLYLQLILFVSWGLCSHFAPSSLPWNLPKFDLQEMGIDVASLLIATGVLVQQARQDKLAEQRSHLILQIELLTEQKIAKLIELIEELRTDMPSVRNRYDWEAQIMQQATDPQVVLNIIKQNLEPTVNQSPMSDSEETNSTQ
ncbi:DUF1003 domain-containing protein [Myxosarcina sp. GI1]|uniref:DUF1003 domain-containing protein n=1 Tax=Myxosarcina sp. GI1 TaxID=1541065 RepID=UPI00056A5870|nr:DUF1003 domain-containing protein [Myxosarcina sp. GI1]